MLLVVALAGAAVVVVAVAALPLRSKPGPVSQASGLYRGSEPPVVFRMPGFSLRDQDGVRIRSRDLRGKAVVLTFLDTQCEETCPVVAGLVADGVRALPAEIRMNVIALAVSADPDEDTPASVRTFLRHNRAHPELRYLVGPLATLEPLWKRFQILSSHESGDDEVHSAPVRVYDPRGIWVSTLHAGADLTPANLAHDVRLALVSTKETE
ncbi:MAG: SCO family protein [Actinobacteria bacterium]|nr:SCO family protein [Actinomycetota bacterium]